MQYDHRPWFLLHPTWFPSTHGDDIMFWLGSVYKLKERTRADERVADELMAILTAFAAKGFVCATILSIFPAFAVDKNVVHPARQKPNAIT